MAPQVGLEPTTLRLTAGCSAIELLRSVVGPAQRAQAPLIDFHHSIPARALKTPRAHQLRARRRIGFIGPHISSEARTARPTAPPFDVLLESQDSFGQRFMFSTVRRQVKWGIHFLPRAFSEARRLRVDAGCPAQITSVCSAATPFPIWMQGGFGNCPRRRFC